MRLTTRTNLAMRTLMFCAVNPDKIVRKAEIAEACNASQNHLGLVIHLLGQDGFIETIRGRNGGVRLGKTPSEISVGHVFRRLESDVPFAECFTAEGNTCPLSDCCSLRGVLCKALGAFYATLDSYTLQDLIEGNHGLSDLLSMKEVA